MAVTSQPRRGGRVAPASKAPKGLEALADVGSVFISQDIDWMDFLIGIPLNQKYAIRKSKDGEQIFMAVEESDCMCRLCCTSRRTYTIKLVNNSGTEVAVFRRPFKCFATNGGNICAGIECCRYESTIEAPEGNVVGTVYEKPTCCVATYGVKDAKDEDIYHISAPNCCKFFCSLWCGNENFPISNPATEEEIGLVTKKFSGVVKEVCTKADDFTIDFPAGANVDRKLAILGSIFLIDFMDYTRGTLGGMVSMCGVY